MKKTSTKNSGPPVSKPRANPFETTESEDERGRQYLPRDWVPPMATYTTTMNQPAPAEVESPPRNALRPTGRVFTEEQLREQEEVQQREQQLQAQIEEQRRQEALKKIQQQHEEQPYAAGSREEPLNPYREAARRKGKEKKTKKVRRVGKTEDGPDYSYEATITDDGSTEISSIAESEKFRSLPQEEQVDAVAKIQAKVGSKFVRELEETGLMEPGVARTGIIEGAQRTLDRFGSGPTVPPLYRRAPTIQPTFNPSIWNPVRTGGGTAGPGGGPGGPGGGPGGPGVLARYAWFQRGDWNPIRQEFRQSFHDGAAPPGPDMKLPKPPTYDGLKRGDTAEAWIQQVERHFYLQPHLYVNDHSRMAKDVGRG